jgi:hypothetical protein
MATWCSKDRTAIDHDLLSTFVTVADEIGLFRGLDVAMRPGPSNNQVSVRAPGETSWETSRAVA